jgi:hypothetical protein
MTRNSQTQSPMKQAPESWENIKAKFQNGVPSYGLDDCRRSCVQEGYGYCSCGLSTSWYQELVEDIMLLAGMEDLTHEMVQWLITLNPEVFIAEPNLPSELSLGAIYRELLTSYYLPEGSMKQVWEQGNEAGAFDFTDIDFRSSILNFNNHPSALAAALRADMSTSEDKVLAGDDRDWVICNIILLADEPTVELLELLADIVTPQDDPDTNIANIVSRGWLALDKEKAQVVIDHFEG